ncbi:putative glycoside hydrolase family 15 protein [Cellulophaga sp. F20128]|uniref:putative glycoside hydrolase n=1 Tax=Cellulophaga sp. F20128 TaxID=2926413 RepID=UPI001FF42CF9|nr:putative glycoside hydrolase [Cellulophaga sp. F20128]MCK0157299.1 putative glycoside hydrolase family 15 protein [Cellulophaga sp. F20128]
MNYKFALLMVILCHNLGTTQEKKTVTNQKNFPEFSWDTMPLYMHLRKGTAFNKKEVAFLAKFPLITFEKTTGSKTYGSTESGTIEAAKAVKMINPKTKILYYKNVVINWGAYKEDEVFLKEYPDALLRNADEKKALMPNGKTGFFDISQEYIRSYWLNHIRKVTDNPHIDGVFLDANIKALVPAFFNSRVGTEKQKEIELGYLSMMQQLHDRFGKDNLLIANIIRVRPEFKDEGQEYLKFFNGSYIEGFEHENFGMTYAEYLSKGIQAVQNAAQNGNIIAMSLGIGKALQNSEIGFDDKRGQLQNTEKIKERIDYLLAIFLVCAEKYSYVYPHDGYGIEKSSIWMKTFPQYNRKLGPPKAAAKKEGYVYTRSFEYVDVWLDIEQQKAVLHWK